MNQDSEHIETLKIPGKLYSIAEKLATELIIESNIFSLPIDPFCIAQQKGIEVRAYSELPSNILNELSTKEQSGFSYFDPIINHSIIYFDDSQCYNRRRFTVAHELGHIVMNHKQDSALAEQLANHFAGYMLVPTPLIFVLDCEDYSEIKKHFSVSDDCAYIRFCRYRDWCAYNIDKSYERKLIKHFSRRSDVYD